MFALIGIVSMFFFVGGASLGALIFYTIHGRLHHLSHQDAIMLWVLPLNLVLLPCLALLWMRRESVTPRMGVASSASLLARHRVPFNKRIAFMVFSIVWIIGVVVVLKYGP